MNNPTQPNPNAPAPTGWRAANIAVGNFFFRYRNSLFPVIFALAALASRPHRIGGRLWIDALWTGLGAIVALLGEATRLATIGFDYIDRGGKNGQVYASRLVSRGVYAMTRNPMYLGNGLLAVGVCMAAGAPMLYLTAVPLFLFIYQAIIAAEENYLLASFGPEYRAYMETTPRLFPALGRAPTALAGFSYDWRKSLRKELSTILGLVLALVWLPVWRHFWLDGRGEAMHHAPISVALSLSLLALFGAAVYLKRSKRFFY